MSAVVRTWQVLVAVALVAIAAGCGPTVYKMQQRQAKSFAPKKVESGAGGATRAGRARVLKVRVYADDEYRAQTSRWEARFEAMLQRVNGVLEPGFAVRLQVVGTEKWPRTANADSLEAMLSELEGIDRGEDVDFVIGMVTGLSQFTFQMHHLGGARVLGKHIILRGMNDVAERKALDEVLDALEPEARERLYLERRAHKELIVFLHELGHALGAIHTAEPFKIMHGAYDHRMTAFAPENAAIIDLILRYRGEDAPAQGGLPAMYRALAEHLRNNPWAGWEQRDYELMSKLAAEAPEPTEVPEPSIRMTPAHRKEYFRAAAFVGEGRYHDAWPLIESLVDLYEHGPEVMRLACDASARLRGLEHPTEKVCERAAELSPDDAEPLLALARAHASRSDLARGLEWMRKAHAKLASAGAARPEQWRAVAELYRAVNAVTWFEEAVAQLPEDDRGELTTWALTTRRRYGLPPKATHYGITPADEGAYLTQVKEAFSLVYAGKVDEARAAIRAGRKRFRDAPGFLVAQCDLEARAGDYRAAQGLCARALRAYEEATWAYYVSGVIAYRKRQYAAAAGAFERLLELDPSVREGWASLARTYGNLGRNDAVDALRLRYRERFNADLP